MKQLSKTHSILYHLYPGLLITLGFIVLTPSLIIQGYPPQFSLLIVVIVVAVPLLLGHLYLVKREENASSLLDLNGLNHRIKPLRLVLYVFILVVAAFLLWGLTQPLDHFIALRVFGWLPRWYRVQDFKGYAIGKIRLTLLLNLGINGILAPLVEEFYFRGYLLPRMQAWGKYAFLVNTLLFSLYHFWQPQVYITLILALLPMIWLTNRRRDLRLSLLTHSIMNLLGALLSLGLWNA